MLLHSAFDKIQNSQHNDENWTNDNCIRTMAYMDIIWCGKASYDNHWCYIKIALKVKRNLPC